MHFNYRPFLNSNEVSQALFWNERGLSRDKLMVSKQGEGDSVVIDWLLALGIDFIKGE